MNRAAINAVLHRLVGEVDLYRSRFREATDDTAAAEVLLGARLALRAAADALAEHQEEPDA